MTTPDPRPSGNGTAPQPQYKDRVYRSPMGLAAGVLLLVLATWLGGDALVRGNGRVPWISLASLLLVVPLVIAFTLRPAVFVGDNRLRVRNPFRIVTLPWSAVGSFLSGYSNEVSDASGQKYQLWALPVSLRGRRTANSKRDRVALKRDSGETVPPQDLRHNSDKVMDELREMHEKHADSPGAQGEVEVRWAYELIGPAIAGAVLLVILIATG